jgi:hypothetical protein
VTDDGWGDGPPADVVEQGSDRHFPSLNWRLPRSGVILLAAGLVIGLVAGYAAGYRQVIWTASPPVLSPSPGSSVLQPLGTGGQQPLLADQAVTQATGTCSVQSGRELQLGVEVTNGSTAPVALGQVHAYFPLGGLRTISQQWGPCGARVFGQAQNLLGPGDSTWFSLTFQVLVKCPSHRPSHGQVMPHSRYRAPGPDRGSQAS